MTDANEPRKEPQGCSLASIIVLSIIGALLVALLLPVYYAMKNTSSQPVCLNNLTQMYKAMHIYKAVFGDNKNYMPHEGDAFWTCLLGHSGPEHSKSYSTKAPMCGLSDVYACDSPASSSSSVIPGGPMDDYKGPTRHPETPSNTPSALFDGIHERYPIACDAPGNHRGAGGNVMWFDGAVAFMVDEDYTDAVSKCAD